MGKYANYFRGNEILPIPEPVEILEPRIVSLVVTDLKTRRLVGLKEGFEDLLRKACVPCQYFCKRSSATWDVLLPSSDQAASSNRLTKFFRLLPEYLGTRRIRVTICNVPAFLTGEVLAAFLSSYGNVEEITLLRSAAGTAYDDCVPDVPDSGGFPGDSGNHCKQKEADDGDCGRQTPALLEL